MTKYGATLLAECRIESWSVHRHSFQCSPTETSHNISNHLENTSPTETETFYAKEHVQTYNYKQQSYH